MLKNMMLYRITNAGHAAILNDWELLAPMLAKKPANLPTGSQWRGIGFAPPAAAVNDHMVWSGADGSQLFAVQFHERQLPGATIKEHVNARVAKIEEREQRKVYRKEVAQIKDEVEAALLPRAFIKHSHVWMIVSGDLLIVGSSSAKKAEDCLCELRSALGSLAVRPLSFKSPAEAWLTELAKHNKLGLVKRSDQAKLVDSHGSTVVFKGVDLDGEEPQEYLSNGFRVAEMLVTYDQNMELRITDQMIFKAIKFADIVFDNVKADSDGDPAALLDGNLVIFMQSAKALINDLIEHLGEDVPKPVTDADLKQLADMGKAYMDEHRATPVGLDDSDDEDF